MKRAAAVMVSLALAGCTGTPAPPASTTSPPVTAPPVTPAATTQAPAGPLQLGITASVSDVKVRVIKYRDRVKLDATPDGPGNHWAGANVRLCYPGGARGSDGKILPRITVSWGPWSLIGDTGDRYPAFENGTAPAFLQPVYPDLNDTPVYAGDCVAGWIMFPVADSAKIRAVRYTGDDVRDWMVR